MIFAIIKSRKGFTLLELLIIVVIMGVLIGVSVPRLRKNYDNFQLENFAKDLFYLSRYLQASAAAEGKIYRLNIDKEKKEFFPQYKVSLTQTGEVTYGGLSGRFAKVYQTPKGVEFVIEPNDRLEIYFFPDASTDQADLIFSNSHQDKITLKFKGASGEIKVE